MTAFDSQRAADVGDAGLPGAGGGSLELVDDQTLSGAATSVTLSGLDGDTDEVYLLLYRIIKNVVATINTDLRPNGVTTNRTTYLDYIGSAGAGAANTTDWHIGGNGSGGTGGVEAGCLWLDAKTGARRTGCGEWVISDGGTHQIVRFMIDWTDTAANITTLDVVCDQANGFGAGSFFRLYKVNRV